MNLDVATTRLLRTLLIGGTIVVAMSAAAEVFKPIALAILLTFLLAPIVTRLERLGLPRVLSVAAVLLAAMTIFGITSYVVGNQFASLAQDVPRYSENIQAKIRRLQPSDESTIDKVMDAFEKLSKSGDESAETAQPVRVISSNDLWDRMHTILGPFESILAMGGIVLLMVVFLLFEREDIGDKIIHLVGWGQIGVTTKTLSQIGEGLSSYLTALALVNAGFGAAIGLGCWAIGLPSPALWGFLAAIFRFIPYLGTVLSFTVPFLISIAHDEGWSHPALVLALFAGCELVVNSVEPMLYGKSTGISPVALLISALFWAWLWGPLGLLLANALTVCLAVAGRSIPGLGVLGTLLSHDVSVSDDLRWYQRVLSRDLDGSLALLDDALKTRSFEEVCDQVVIPSLSRAEHDRTHEYVDGRDVAFIWRAVREWLDDMSERDDLTTAAALPDGSTQVAKADAEARLAPRPPVEGEDGPIVGVATGGGADALVLRMINLALKPSGVRLTILSAGGSSLKVTDKVSELEPAMVLVSHLPPVGLTRARYLTKRMRSRHPETPVTFGYWDWSAETPHVVESLKPATASRVVVSVAAARASILDRTPASAAAPAPANPPALAEAGRA